MGIDRIYELAGTAIKRVFYRTVKRPVANINVENRAQKAIEKKTAAPWHETTKKVIEELKQTQGSNFKEYNEKNPNLVEHMKQIKIVSQDFVSDPEKRSEAKLPKQRFGASVPFVFLKPKEVPIGKITPFDVLSLVMDHRENKVSASELAEQYRLSVQDVENILKYVNIFKVYNKDMKELKVYSQLEDGSTTEPEPETPVLPHGQIEVDAMNATPTHPKK